MNLCDYPILSGLCQKCFDKYLGAGVVNSGTRRYLFKSIDGTLHAMIPSFQKMFLPILKITGDQQEHSLNEIAQNLAKQFSLSDQERLQVLSSRKTTSF